MTHSYKWFVLWALTCWTIQASFVLWGTVSEFPRRPRSRRLSRAADGISDERRADFELRVRSPAIRAGFARSVAETNTRVCRFRRPCAATSPKGTNRRGGVSGLLRADAHGHAHRRSRV